MKILLFTQWFDPEPTFKGLTFAKELVSQGHEVEVLTGYPNYPGGKVYSGYNIKPYTKMIMDGVVVHRVALYPDHGKSAIKRVLNYTSFGLTSMIFGLFFAKKFDVIYVYHPPLTTGLAAALISLIRRTPFVIDVQDLWPDTLSATGMLNNKKALSIVGAFCGWVYKRAAHIVVLSPGFKSKLLERGVSESKISLIYNWCDEHALINSTESEYELPASGFNIVFAGNLGFAQGIPSLINAARLLQQSGQKINIVLIGSGVSLESAKSQVASQNINNVFFIPRVPMIEVGSLLKKADALLVHLTDNELFRITIPSRTQAYMCIGKPVIMAVAGDASDLITLSRSGYSCEPDEPAELAKTMANLANLPKDRLSELGRNARNFYVEQLSLEVGVRKFVDVFLKVIK